MKNVIVIGVDNGYSCELISSVNDGTNSLFLEIKADTSNNPTLEIQEESIPISDSDFTYQIASDLFVGDGEITFRIIDDSQTSEYFHISKVNALDGNMFLKQISDYSFSLSIQPKVGGGSCECIIDNELSLTSDNPVQNKVITARLNEVFQSVSNGKDLIASAITDKGISTDSDAAFQQMADNIRLIGGAGGNIELADSVTNILSAIKSIDIPNNVNTIGESAFNGCNYLERITIPNSVTYIGDNAFYKCASLTSITIPDSVTSIRLGTFYYCTSLTSITIPDSVISIGESAFYYCTSLTSITIPDTVTEIKGNAFEKCRVLKNHLIIPNGITSIESYTFADCQNLTDITIPDSVISIKANAFYHCYKLTNIYYTGTETQWNAITKGSNWNTSMGSIVSGGTKIHYNYAA